MMFFLRWFARMKLYGGQSFCCFCAIAANLLTDCNNNILLNGTLLLLSGDRMKRALLVIILASMPAFHVQSMERGTSVVVDSDAESLEQRRVRHRREPYIAALKRTCAALAQKYNCPAVHAALAQVDPEEWIDDELCMDWLQASVDPVMPKKVVFCGNIVSYEERDVNYGLQKAESKYRKRCRKHIKKISSAAKAFRENEALAQSIEQDRQQRGKQMRLAFMLFRDHVDADRSQLEGHVAVLGQVQAHGIITLIKSEQEKILRGFQEAYTNTAEYGEWLVDVEDIRELTTDPDLADRVDEIDQELESARVLYDQLPDDESLDIYREVFFKRKLVSAELARRNRAVEVAEQKAEN
jgi:hypothetical protein